MENVSHSILLALLLSLRMAPTFAYAPPFTLLRIPAFVRVFLAYALALWMIDAAPPSITTEDIDLGFIVTAAFAELLLGAWLALSLQIAFAALLVVGRTIDFQVGFGLALIADPTLRTQMPLVGSLLAYAGAAVFFAGDGPADLVAIWSHSLSAIPIGGYEQSHNLSALLAFMSASLSIALGLAGVVIIVLFLSDTAIALLSRTLPQMNVLVLGFQVKTLALLLTLPILFASSGALFLRLVRLALQTTPRLT
jgi:flagellar biosynthetic protein FliR